jgi:hypothetical protein
MIEIIIPVIAQIVVLGVAILYLTKFYLPRFTQQAINDIFLELQEKVLNPNVKRAMSIIGSQGAENRDLKLAEEHFSSQVIDSQIGDIKPLLQNFLGIDLDEMIEKYGASNILKLINKYLPMAKGMLSGSANDKSAGSPNIKQIEDWLAQSR